MREYRRVTGRVARPANVGAECGRRERGEGMRDSRIWKVAVVGAVLLAASACGKKATPPPQGGGTSTAGSPGGTPIPQFTTLTQGQVQVASCLEYAPFEVVKQGKP